jgi:hypothetical protein
VRRIAIGVALAALTIAGLAQSAAARPIPGQASILVRTSGTITGPTGSRTSTLALTPATVSLKTLDRLGWKDRDALQEPHLWVFTMDSTKVLGRTIDDGKPCPLCDTAAQEMAAALAVDPQVTRVEHGDTGGLDAEGDAYLDRLNDDVWVRVHALPGSTWFYMDAYHPWLHGEVDVHA